MSSLNRQPTGANHHSKNHHSASARRVQIRAMQPTDVAAVVAVQAECYAPFFHEAAAVIATRLVQSPQTAWVAHDAEGVKAYLVAYRSTLGSVTPLNDDFAPDHQGECLYVHDLAVSPRLAGQGVSGQLLACAFDWARQHGLTQSGLVSVQQSQGFWQRLGYQAVSVQSDTAMQALGCYGEGACYMAQSLPFKAK